MGKKPGAPKFTAANHFTAVPVQKRLSNGATFTKIMVLDMGYEARATALLQASYVKSFLKKSKWERTKGGLRSYAEKKWTSGGGRKLAKQGLKYAIAGAAFATLAAITGPGALIILGVGLAASALTKGGAKAADEINSFSDRLKNTGDPNPINPDSTDKAIPPDSPSKVMPVVLENEGITTVVGLLFRHWSDIRLFRETYCKDWKPGKALKKSYEREFLALKHFKDAGTVEEWRNWEAGEAGKLRNFSEYFSALSDVGDRAARNVAKRKPNKMSMVKTDVNFMRLKIKKLTFYNACLMDYCRMMTAEQALLQEAVVKAWEQVVSLTQRQAHIRSDHSRCDHKKSSGCFGGLDLLAELVGEDKLGHIVVMDDPPPTSPPPGFEAIANREQTMKDASAVMDFFRKFPGRRTKSEFVQKKVVDTAGKWAAKKAASSTVKAAKTGTLPGIGTPDLGDLTWPKLGDVQWGDLGRPSVNGPEAPDIDPGWPSVGDINWPRLNGKFPKAPTLGDLGGIDVDWPDVGALGAGVPALGVNFYLQNQVIEPVPGLGALVGDLTDFLFQHFHNLDLRDHMKELDAMVAGLEKEEVELEHGGRIVKALKVKSTEQNEKFFRDQLPSHPEMDNFKKELHAAASKVRHYVLKGDRRRKRFLELYDQITLGASEAQPAHCKNCKEAFKLSYAFFDMVKTMWKLEQHIMFLDVFAKGVLSGLKEQSATYHFPYEAGGSLAEWFRFWHHLEPQDPSDGVAMAADLEAEPLPDGESTGAVVDVFEENWTPLIDSDVEDEPASPGVAAAPAATPIQPVPHAIEYESDQFALSSSSASAVVDMFPLSDDFVLSSSVDTATLRSSADPENTDEFEPAPDAPASPPPAAPVGMTATQPANAAEERDPFELSSDD